MCASAVFCSYLGGIRNVRKTSMWILLPAANQGLIFQGFFATYATSPQTRERFTKVLHTKSALQINICHFSYLHEICSLAYLALSRNKQHLSFAPCLLYSRLFYMLGKLVFGHLMGPEMRGRGRGGEPTSSEPPKILVP